MVMAELGLLTLTHYLFSNQIDNFQSLGELVMAPFLTGFRYIRNLGLLVFTHQIDLIKERWWFKSGIEKTNIWRPLVGGLVIGLPVVLLLAMLLNLSSLRTFW